MTNRAIARRRLRSQLIVRGEGGAATPAEAVRRLGAVQAQEYAQFLWAVGLRAPGADAEAVERAVAEREIVLTWALRGTLHAVPADDVHWMLERFARRVLDKDRRRREQLELDAALLARCEELIGLALKERGRMSRPELMDLLERAGIRTQPQRGYHILWYLAQTGLICLGPKDGKQQTFVLLEDWAPRRSAPRPEEASGELAKRYFSGHGPATANDFAWWAGLTVKEARAEIEAAQDALVSETYGGAEYWTGRGGAGGIGTGGETGGAGSGADGGAERAGDADVRLLPGYDEYLLGYKDRSAVLEPEHAPRIVLSSNGVLAPLLLVDGIVAGIWKRTLRKDGVEMAVSPFSPLEGLKERAEEAARSYCDFIGAPLSRLVIA